VTFVEFVAPLKTKSHRSKVLAAMYYRHRYENAESMRAEEIRSLLISARLPKAKAMNVPDLLNKSGAFVDSPGSDGTRRLWKLTETGHQEVRRLLNLPEAEPEIEHDVSLLTKLTAKVADDDARGFIEEAIRCLQVGALRAAVVFLWSGAIRTLHSKALAKGVPALNAAILKHDPKMRKVSQIDDFAYVKDSTLLLALQDLGVVDKGQRATLEEGLNLRNRSGHPTKYRPGEKKASSFIEDIIGIIFK
jgi:hypothetical protein